MFNLDSVLAAPLTDAARPLIECTIVVATAKYLIALDNQNEAEGRLGVAQLRRNIATHGLYRTLSANESAALQACDFIQGMTDLAKAEFESVIKICFALLLRIPESN